MPEWPIMMLAWVTSLFRLYLSGLLARVGPGHEKSGRSAAFPVGKMRGEEGDDPVRGDFSGNGDNSVIRAIISGVKLSDIIRRNTRQRLRLA